MHIYVRIVERVVLFALEQRRRARRERRFDRFPEWRDVLILFYYIRLVPEEVHQRMEFPLMLTVLSTVAPKMHSKIEAGVVTVQRRWRLHQQVQRQSQTGAFYLPFSPACFDSAESSSREQQRAESSREQIKRSLLCFRL